MNSPHKRVRQGDFARALVTETLPYETPVIFAADGIYKAISSLDTTPPLLKTLLKVIVMGEGTHRKPKWTVPLRYKIRKNAHEFRRLALLHPAAQWRATTIYRDYANVILHYCSLSQASIRAPAQIASSLYKGSTWEDLYQFRSGEVALLEWDQTTRHSPSYFAYKGVNRLYKFFDSEDFFRLEKKYKVMQTLDVSKCFDSIYTHSLSWAVKDKSFTKEHVSVSATFAQKFDDLMQFCNHSETNGIVIGPEFSRVFAEIIFQAVDSRVVDSLLPDLKFGGDYELRRYVDDLFIFAKSLDTAGTVYRRYSDELMEFNLFANREKSITRERPFATDKSRRISAASLAINEFVDAFLESGGEHDVLISRPIRSEWKLARSFLNRVKAICSETEASYDDLASFVIAALTERVKKLARQKTVDIDRQSDTAAAIRVLLNVQFFFYGVAPTVSASYKLCTSVLIALRFAQKFLGPQARNIDQYVYDLIVLHLTRSVRDDEADVESFVPLESLNLLVAAREIGSEHLLPADLIASVFFRTESLPYFQIMCGLWYMQAHSQYAHLRSRLVDSATARLGTMSQLASDAEQAYLFLDLIACPFVDTQRKKDLLRKAGVVVQFGAATNSQVEEVLANVREWNVKWSDADLLSLLAKKELKQAY